MAPFQPPRAIIKGVKERIESLLVQGDKLYVGTATGNVHIYVIHDGESSDGEQRAELLETKKALSRRAIEQLGFVQDINSIAVLTDSNVVLYPLPSFAPPTPLPKAKGALSFVIHTLIDHGDETIQRDTPSSPSPNATSKTPNVPVVVTYLIIGCRRKVVIHEWRDGEPQDAKEANLPHSPRAIAFLTGDVVCFGYTPTDYALFSLKTMSTIEITTPVTIATSTSSIGNMGKGAFSGLSGYMTLGLGAKAKPNALRTSEGEVLIAKDNTGVFLGTDGKPSRPAAIDWPAPPEEAAFVKPYVFSIFPAGSVPTSQLEGDSTSTSFISTPVVEIRSSISLLPVQTLPIPLIPPPPGAPPTAHNQTVRLLTSSSGAKSPLYLVTTPVDRPLATAEGSTIVEFVMKPWGQQLDELVEVESYAEALSLLETLDQAILPDKDKRYHLIRALNAVSQFRAGNFREAINTFIALNVNPAKVVALYPENISGRLHVPQDEWIPLFGGPRKAVRSQRDESLHLQESTSIQAKSQEESQDQPTQLQQTSSPPQRPPSPQGSIRGVLKSGLESIMNTARKEDDTSSIRSKRKEPPKDDSRRSVEELMLFLSDRRPKINGALEAFHITSDKSHEMPFLSTTSIEDLFALPDAPLSSLTPEQLVRYAQIVDTALFKSYLLVRPGLLASLCRVGNWCDVEEVEEMLRAREKFSELIYLYNGKKMHGKALELLRQLAEQESDPRDKLMPSVTYLQRLGPEHIDQIFQSARWIFEQDPEIALEIFTSEEVELPRHQVADYLEMIDPALCARYIEFLIAERGEESEMYHDRLAELYLRMTIAAKKRGDNEKRRELYSKLLDFIDTTTHYRPDRLYGLLPPEDLYEAKAILLGRLGRHDGALETYVHRLQDFHKAEEYCKRIYDPNGPTSSIFLTLLRIYLRPNTQSSQFSQPSSTTDLLQPALDLISRHSPRLDIVETLKLLPPLVTAQDVRAFLVEALRAPVFDRKVISSIAKARDEQVTRRLMVLQAKRVKVTDTRICPQCHKRIGYSVIAVHAPRGEVTHYQCREAFAKKLKELRH
ncbi:hypothetical protein K474DRAFT_1626886 [Panus rudis PR-1116 ss-1]|nr:hypothetical protein K474DRAFT_1626886 [Panus rudis PR-1116 ss-1]